MSDNNVHRFKVERHEWPDEIERKSKKNRKRFIIIILGLLLFGGGFFAGTALDIFTNTSTPDRTISDPTKMEQIKDILENQWYFAGEYGDSIDEDLINKAINGMVDNPWDPHTSYMTPEEMESFSTSLSGHFVGIGVQYYDMGNSTYVISKVFKDSPAETAGILSGDQILKVDGKSTLEVDIDTVAEMVKGEEGSEVEVTVLRSGKEVTMKVIRKSIVSSVFYEVKGDVGILEITSFADTTAEDTREILEKFKEQGVKSIIIDLRDNGGGYLDTAQKLASLFVPANSITFNEKYSDGSTKEFGTNNGFKQYTYDKVVIVVNGDSASASEVLTLSLKENIDCTVVGVTTYGKGTMQQTQVFDDESALKYTVGEWLSPTGKSINGTGIKPDVEVALDPALTDSVYLIGDVEVLPNTVNEAAATVQKQLKFLGYDVERTDAYYAPSTEEAIKKYQSDNGMEATGIINDDLIKSLVSSSNQKFMENNSQYDTQMRKAYELVNLSIE